MGSIPPHLTCGMDPIMQVSGVPYFLNFYSDPSELLVALFSQGEGRVKERPAGHEPHGIF